MTKAMSTQSLNRARQSERDCVEIVSKITLRILRISGNINKGKSESVMVASVGKIQIQSVL